jgi:hypothetical protein
LFIILGIGGSSIGSSPKIIVEILAPKFLSTNSLILFLKLLFEAGNIEVEIDSSVEIKIKRKKIIENILIPLFIGVTFLLADRLLPYMLQDLKKICQKRY